MQIRIKFNTFADPDDDFNDLFIVADVQKAIISKIGTQYESDIVGELFASYYPDVIARSEKRTLTHANSHDRLYYQSRMYARGFMRRFSHHCSLQVFTPASEQGDPENYIIRIDYYPDNEYDYEHLCFEITISKDEEEFMKPILSNNSVSIVPSEEERLRREKEAKTNINYY